ncbi:MAG TPA: Hsp33 family molecular chaperone HslO, partial [Archangium sp.]
MADSVVRALLTESNLKVSVAVLTGVAREGRARHGLKTAAAALFAQGLTGAALMASLQKGQARINVQLECDGPLRGFFVDAGADGDVRGYVKNPAAEVQLAEGEFQWRAALGNSGFISVLRDMGGEYYRSSVELISMRLADDLNHYFKISDQIATHVALAVQREGSELLGKVAGVLIQALPDGDVSALQKLARDLEARLSEALDKPGVNDATALLAELFPGHEALI